MFFTGKQKLIFFGFIFIIILIPLVSFVISQRINQTTNKLPTTTVTSSPPKADNRTSLDDLKRSSSTSSSETGSPTATSSGVTNLSFGPTLNLKIALEGKKEGNFAIKAFVGLAQGIVSTSPKYLLTFTLDFPSSGEFKGLSLAGLNIGQTYTAYIKGPSQIATSSAFVVNPNQTNLNNSQPLMMPSGDLNEDNVINSLDYNILKKLFGTTPTSANWNLRADINGDGVVNSVDLSYLSKNQGKIGAGGVWVSPTPVASSSATPRSAGPSGAMEIPTGQGYSLLIPNL